MLKDIFQLQQFTKALPDYKRARHNCKTQKNYILNQLKTTI